MLFYRGFAKTLAERVTASLTTIETNHNFEYGVEFEIALCEALRSALPDQYGIARGYAVDRDGRTAGDDILIFARERFPTLALRAHDDFARKEFVPIEAVYAYIEAKHSLHVEGTGPQSLQHTCEQVSRVKSLCATREPVMPGQLGRYVNLGAPFQAKLPDDHPRILNPPFGVVFARYVRRASGDPPCVDGAEAERLLDGARFSASNPPDVLVLGENLVGVPTVPGDAVNTRGYRSPFFIEGRSAHVLKPLDHLAFGVGFASILAALDWIQLGVLPWHDIIVNALGIPPK